MANEVETVFKKIDDTIIDLKKILEQVTDLRVKCAQEHVKILGSYQPLSLIVLDALRKEMVQMETTTNHVNNYQMEQ